MSMYLAPPLVPIVHPDMFWYRVPEETSMLPVSPLKMSKKLVQRCAEKFESLSLTASSSDIECPPDSDACYVQSRGSWGTAGTTRRWGGGREGGTRGSGQLQTSCQIHWDLKRAQQTAAPWASLQSCYHTTTMERFTRWSNTMWFYFQMTTRQTEWIKRDRARLLLVGGCVCVCVLLQYVCPHVSQKIPGKKKHFDFHPKLLVPLVFTHVQLYSHPLLLLLDGTTSSSAWGFLIMSRQWMVSAWHRNLFWSTYTPPFSISAREEKKREMST